MLSEGEQSGAVQAWMFRAWMIRAGRDGERAAEALASGAVIVGWEEVGDLGAVADRLDLRRVLTASFPDASLVVISNWAGQLWRFKEEIAVGDLVVMPLPERRLAIGRVTGPYSYQADAEPGLRHRRAVEWLLPDLPRDALAPDLRDSMGSLLTIFELGRNGAPDRIAALVEDGADPGPADSAATVEVGSPKLLEERVRGAVADGDTLRVTVRELLAAFGHTTRWPTVVEEVNTGLDELGLATRPPFATENINMVVEVVPVGVEPDVGVSVPTAAELPAVVEDDLPVTLLVKQLPSAQTEVVHVGPEDDLHRATTLMSLNGFSQLPVLDAKGWLRGAVTWESVGMAYISHPVPTLAHATVPALEADGGDDLLDWISAIYERGFIFVRDAEHRVVGIITTADMTMLLANQTRPFLLVAEIERRLRRIVDRALADGLVTLEELRRLTSSRRRIESAKDLTLGSYQFVLCSDPLWEKLGWKMDRELLRARLDVARSFRNDLMHLNPDVETSAEAGLAPLRGLLNILKTLDHGA